MIGKRVILILSLVVIVLTLSAMYLLKNDSNKNNLTDYIVKTTDFEILSLQNSKGIIKMDIGILNDEAWLREDFIQLEVKNILDQIKAFPVKNMNEITEVNIRFFPISSSSKIVRFFSSSNSTKMVAEIRVVNETLYSVQWGTINVNEVPSVVDYYFYNSL